MTDQQTSATQKGHQGISPEKSQYINVLYLDRFINWSILLNLRHMLLFIQRGFELDLYSLQEMPSIFIYLDMLYSSAANHRKLLVAGLFRNGNGYSFSLL